ncbi:MAG: DUF5666 domain-containing protein [Acidobacteriia bacterium]|nr:DUF5666 domain-containing protein [Terriglobia bacterium]
MITAVDATAHTIVVRGTTVSVPAGAVIRHGHTMLTFADLTVGTRVHVKASQSGATTVASEVNVQSEDRPDDTATGVVSALAGTCPAVTFMAGTTKVSTTATTRFTDGTCAELANGVTAHVKGARQADGSIVADRVFFEDNDKEHVRANGTVSGLAGTCPALTFMAGTTKVTTDATTKFSGVTCETLANGANVHVEGTQQADGTLTAARVRLDMPEPNDDHETDHMEGTVSGLAGACPALTFSVGTLKVSTSASTIFRGGSCGQLANGVRVEVTGMSQADGSVGATRVTLDNDGSR